MKKLLLIPLLLLTVLSMAACGGGDDEPFRPGQPETPEQPGEKEDGEPETTRCIFFERKYYCRRPYRYRYDGRQCRRTGFPLSPAS